MRLCTYKTRLRGLGSGLGREGQPALFTRPLRGEATRRLHLFGFSSAFLSGARVAPVGRENGRGGRVAGSVGTAGEIARRGRGLQVRTGKVQRRCVRIVVPPRGFG